MKEDGAFYCVSAHSCQVFLDAFWCGPWRDRNIAKIVYVGIGEGVFRRHVVWDEVFGGLGTDRVFGKARNIQEPLDGVLFVRVVGTQRCYTVVVLRSISSRCLSRLT